jgi:hypothetical protein
MRGYLGPKHVLSQGMRIYSGQTCGEILPAHGYRDRGNDWCGLLLSLVLFRLMAHPHIWYGVLDFIAICH